MHITSVLIKSVTTTLYADLQWYALLLYLLVYNT